MKIIRKLTELRIKHIVTGQDFRLKKRREGDHRLLNKYSKLTVVEKTEDCLSTLIRNSLYCGDFRRVNNFLGRKYKITGRVIHGDKNGRKIGFPTANVNTKKLFLPKFGVYAVRIEVEGFEGIFEGIANIGKKPTFGGNAETLEVFIFDFNKDIYGRLIKIEFICFIREEKKFDSIVELKKQIKIDCKKVRELVLEKH